MSTAVAAARRHRRRKLRIAIRELGRGELHVLVVRSLEIDDAGVQESADKLIQQLGSLRQHLFQSKISA